MPRPTPDRAASALLLVLCLAAPTATLAEPAFARLYKQQYGYTPSCNICHKDGGGTPLNNYGEQYKEAGMTLAAFNTIAKLDSDADEFSNAEEARGKSNPADSQSTPKAPGNWLDIASLIPKEVQALFPDVRSYLPRDAVLTPEEIRRAEQMGVLLTADDENTIYIPVKDRKPVGTALIFPAVYDGRSYFLLMSTDRKLSITKVEPLNTRLVPEARETDIYSRFEGVSVDELPNIQGSSIDASISNAVKKAGTLLWVRLKGA